MARLNPTLRHPGAAAHALLAAGLLLAGGSLAVHHPIVPAIVLLAFTGWTFAFAWRPSIGLVVLPLALPLLDFSPWTGWLPADEFDLLLIAAAAATQARAAWGGAWPAKPALTRRERVFAVALGAPLCIGLYRGLADAGFGAGTLDLYGSEASPANTLRVAKSFAMVLLLAPWLREALWRDPQRSLAALRTGMLGGLAIVGASVLWERAAYVGLGDFSTPYRTTALFWEMHVGGAAIDGYLALAVPFVAWALHGARSPRHWAGAAALALLAAYAALTTFSRGVYLATLAPLLLVAVLLWGRRGDAAARRALLHKALVAALTIGVATAAVLASTTFGYAAAAAVLGLPGALALAFARGTHRVGWRVLGARGLALLLAMEAAAVLLSGSFMNTRIAAADADLASRVAHWRNGIGLLHGPADWLFGLGWGRLPVNYARFVAQREFSGDVAWVATEGRPAARVAGPKTMRILAGQFALTQRVSLAGPGPYRVALDLRADDPATVALSVCEIHLLYERRCQRADVQAGAAGRGWQHVELLLQGERPDAGRWFAPRLGVFAISLLDQGVGVEVGHVELHGGGPAGLLANGDFADGLAHWFPAAQDYFVPWHIDNLYLELLIESGLTGLLAFLGLMAAALHHLLRGAAREHAASAFLAAALCGALLVGTVSSLIDMPRIAVLLLFLLSIALRLRAVSAPGCNPVREPEAPLH